MKRIFLTSVLVSMICILGACSQAEKKATEAQPTPAVQEPAPGQAAPKIDEEAQARLLQPFKLNETAPSTFLVDIKTTKGVIRAELHRDWSPMGVDRFYNLVKAGFFTDIAMFRMVKGFVVQFGIHGSPLVSSVWRDATIADEPTVESNTRGTITFAKGGPNSRTTQLFINLADNSRLDKMGFPPIGKIISGMEVVEALNYEYAEVPKQPKIQMEGNEYLRKNFPNMDYIQTMTIVEQ